MVFRFRSSCLHFIHIRFPHLIGRDTLFRPGVFFKEIVTGGLVKTGEQTSLIEYGSADVPTVVASYGKYLSNLAAGTELAVPEQEAIEFYLLNAAMAELSHLKNNQESLTHAEQVLLDLYYTVIRASGHRCFFYLLLICTRETRHVGETSKILDYLTKAGTLPLWKMLNGMSSSGAVTKFLQNPPPVTMKVYTQHLVDVFTHGYFGGSSFGGPKWANVARPLRDFVHGTITMEMLLDTLWTLRHNGGPIFNKGMLYTGFDNDELTKILDVQRAGQIPGLVGFTESPFVMEHHANLLMLAQNALPGFGTVPVDWAQVHALGAIGSAAAKKLKPKPMYPGKQHPGVPPLLQITPSDFVKKITRAETK
jgi:hypothetical protein